MLGWAEAVVASGQGSTVTASGSVLMVFSRPVRAKQGFNSNAVMAAGGRADLSRCMVLCDEDMGTLLAVQGEAAAVQREQQ